MSKYKDAESILQEVRYCKVCGFEEPVLARQHVFEGPANRRQSAKYGLWVWVCPDCHKDIHERPEAYKKLKQDAQEIAMKTYGWSVDDFRRIFGKNYL